MERWFRRFADIPGLDYQRPLDLDFKYPPQFPLTPQERAYTTFEGVQRQILWWKTPQGEGSASPASRWQTSPISGETESQTAIRQLAEALELPGMVRDYHFRLQGCCETLWRNRDAEPIVLWALENFALLDLRLLERFPETLISGVADPPFMSILACGRLVYLYEREGYLQEALTIAERGMRLHQDTMGGHLDRLRKRLAALEAEDE